MVLDGAILLLAANVVARMVARVNAANPPLEWSLNALFFVLPVIYFQWCGRLGQSPGMKVVRVRVTDASSGGLPSPARMFVRAVIATVYFVLFLGAVPLLGGLFIYLVLVSVLGPPNEEHRIALGVFVSPFFLIPAAIFLAITIANLWTLWDPRRRTLIDKLCNVVVVDDHRPRPTVTREQSRSEVAPRQALNQPDENPV